MKPIIRCLIPIHYRNEKCDFRFITLDEFCDNKENVIYIEENEMKFTPESLPSIPHIVLLKPIL